MLKIFDAFIYRDINNKYSKNNYNNNNYFENNTLKYTYKATKKKLIILKRLQKW